MHLELKDGVTARLLGDKIEKIPLRHQGDEAAMRRQMGKIADLDELAADVRAEGAGFLMRTAQELIQYPKLVHDLKGRRMDRVAAEITQEVCMLFEDKHGDSGAGQ